MTDELEQAALSDEQRAAFLAVIDQDKTIGNIAALRRIGVTGHKRDLRALVDDELEEQARLARGWNIRKVEDTYWGVALDPEHPHYERAAGRLLKAYGGRQFREQTVIEHGGSVDVDSPDLAAAIDRFTSLADAAVRAAARTRARSALADAAGPGESDPGLPVARLDRPA